MSIDDAHPKSEDRVATHVQPIEKREPKLPWERHDGTVDQATLAAFIANGQVSNALRCLREEDGR